MEKVSFEHIEINNGFWKERQDTVREKTVWRVYDRFYETGRIKTMNSRYKYGDSDKPHIFWGSDVFKWIEGAAYLLGQKYDEKLFAAVDGIVRDVEESIEEDGYYNSYFCLIKDPRFTDRNAHELYSAGHMIEAGVAVFDSLGDRRLLDIAVKNADLIYKVFKEEGSAAFDTPGHEEIELALVRLYLATENEKYLELAEFFLKKRGMSEKDKPIFQGPFYAQDQLPVSEQTEAVGHAVRAVYLYSAMVDVAVLKNDGKMLSAAKKLFNNITNKQMYITGGIGSVQNGEKFGGNYHLPNRDAYAETCAALGLALFAGRLCNAEPDSRYADTVERALYNGMISGLSLDGESFFYENPLEMDTDFNKNTTFRHAPAQRRKLFDCSCCPPNLTRLIPSVANFIYGKDGDRLFVHQYISNTADIDGKIAEIITDYPLSGKVTVHAEGMKLTLRRPFFGKTVVCSEKYTEKNGYLYFDTDTVTVEFDMTPKFYSASSRVRSDIGKVALMRGPIVYCIESGDQEARVFDCTVDPKAPLTVCNEKFGAFPVIKAKGFIKESTDELYGEYSDKRRECTLKFIPYYTFANRKEDDMQVFVNV